MLPSDSIRAGWIAALALLLPTPAHAGGFTIPLIGARMSGQGAFVSHPDDASAVYHNPAGLGLVPGLRIDLSGTMIFTNTAYTRVDYPEIGDTGQFDTSRAPSGPCPPENAATGYDAGGYVLAPCYRPTVSPESKWGTIPFGGIALDAGRGLAFGFGVYSPHNAVATFPADGAQRYEIIDGAITTLYFGPAAAWRLNPALVLGAGLSVIRATARYNRAFWLPDDLRRVNPGEILVDLDGSGWAFGWSAGLVFVPRRLLPWLGGLEVGVSYTSRATLDFEGEVAARGASATVGALFEPGYEEGQVIRRAATARFTVPDVVRVGLGYDFGPRAWVGADVYWSHYSLYDSLTIALDEPLGTITELRQDKFSINCWSAAVGGRLTPLPPLDARLGVFVDQSPYPDEYYTTLSPDSDRGGLTAGLSWRLGLGVELSLSYVVLFYADRRITNSLVRPELGVQAPFSANGEVVGKVVQSLGVQLAWSRARLW